MFGFERFFEADWRQQDAFNFEEGVGVVFLFTTDFVIVGENDRGSRVVLIGIDDLFGVLFVVDVVLMGDGDKGGSSGMNGEIEVAPDVGVGAFNYFEMVLCGQAFDMFIRRSGGDYD